MKKLSLGLALLSSCSPDTFVDRGTQESSQCGRGERASEGVCAVAGDGCARLPTYVKLCWAITRRGVQTLLHILPMSCGWVSSVCPCTQLYVHTPVAVEWSADRRWMEGSVD